MVMKPRSLTTGIHSLAQLRLHLTVGPLSRQLRQLAGHGGGRDDGLEAALAFGDVLLGVEDDDVDLRHVEHAQRDGGAEAERDGQRGCLDVHLKTAEGGVTRQRRGSDKGRHRNKRHTHQKI